MHASISGKRLRARTHYQCYYRCVVHIMHILCDTNYNMFMCFLTLFWAFDFHLTPTQQTCAAAFIVHEETTLNKTKTAHWFWTPFW